MRFNIVDNYEQCGQQSIVLINPEQAVHFLLCRQANLFVTLSTQSSTFITEIITQSLLVYNSKGFTRRFAILSNKSLGSASFQDC